MVNGRFSNYRNTTHGVPQGSVLGPVLFLLYINDIVSIIDESSVYLYADDTVLFDTACDPTTVFMNLQCKLNAVVDWCTMNKLTLNIKKTKALLFFPKPNNYQIPSFVVHAQTLEYVDKYKYLGYLIDSKLLFDKLLTKLITTIVHKLYLLSKMRPMLTQKAALAIYKSKIMTFFDYSAVFHYATRVPLLRKLQVLQNRAIRIILKLPARTNVDRNHLELGIWHLDNRREYFLLCTMFQLIMRPDFPFLDNRDLRTRSHVGRMFRFPSNCTTTFRKSFLYVGMQCWNQLPPDVRNIITFNLFKNVVKQMIREREAVDYDGWSVVSSFPGF